MQLKEVQARVILDSRKDKTIEVSVKTNYGLFSTSAPSGKSKGRNETPSYIRSVEDDCKEIINANDKLKKIDIDKFSDLEKVELIVKGIIGANPLYALETSLLKALALEQGKQLWQVLNAKAKKMPSPIGNCIGGGLHTPLTNGMKPDFQEFEIIPRARNFADSCYLMKQALKICGETLDLRNAKGRLNDENAYSTSLGNEEVLSILDRVREELELSGDKISIGIDVAASSFYSRGVYEYKNPFKKSSAGDQKEFIKNLVKNYRIFYVEDPFNEEDFMSFYELKRELNEEKPALIVGDDLICSKPERLQAAIQHKSINAVIVKPNQVGSLIDIAKLVGIAKKNDIATVFSHRSGETMDYSLADFAFGLQTEFVKTGIQGREREIKLNRLIEIEKSLI